MNKYWSPQEALNSGKRKTPSKKLLAYLEDFRTDNLTTGDPRRPDGYASQREVLVKAMKSLYPTQGLHQTVDGLSVDISNFWELLLTLHHLTHDIKLTGDMGYYRKQIGAGIYVTKEQPYAELEITSMALKQTITTTHQNIQSSPIATMANTTTNTPNYVTLRSYDADTGVLFFGTHIVQIIRQKNRQGKVGETIQGAVMRKLFKDVNTLSNGVALRKIISVRGDNFDTKKRKMAINHLDEINRKIEETTGVPNLITHDNVNYYMNKSYLK